MADIELVAKKLARLLLNAKDIGVVGHYDADGITSMAILVEALERAGKNVEYTNLKQLYSDDVENVQDLGDLIVFVDMGAGQIPFLAERMEKPFVIVDHHRRAGEHPYMLHPEDFGLDGARDVSGAGLAYLLARALGNNEDLAKLAVVGAVGDMQLEGKVIGLTRSFLMDAIRAGDIFAYKDLALYGRVSRPLAQMLMFSTDPILPGLTANEEACYRLLSLAGIELKNGDEWRTYADLSHAERRKLFTTLSLYLYRKGWRKEKVLSLIGEVYDLPAEELHSPLREVREFATLLNATGRHGYPEIGVEVARGDREKKYEEALALWRRHRRLLREGISWLLEHGVEEGEHIYFFHARHHILPTIVGIVAGMVYGSGLIPTDRPIFALAYEGDWVKVSARATRSLVRRGLDLSKVVRKAAKEVGGEGGGHKPAAGARIPRGSEEEFVRMVDELVGLTLHDGDQAPS